MRFATGQLVAWGLLTALLLAMLPVRAETVRVVLQMTRHTVAGPVRAGTVLGRGEIRSSVTHSGYALWLDNETDGDRPGCYRLTGKTKRAHVVRVCLSGDGWYAGDISPEQRWVYPGSDKQASFILVSSVDQTIPADTYVIQVKGDLHQE
ncbi:hypothetical protein GW742_06490 [Citrobacter freundii]|nr:hypothetical protein [Citrobacter freundii]MBC6506000.1 hypothetical protein [Citrobacter freundii]MBC6556674.1 hypothetical protein [Citrobacter braakii]